MTGGAGFIGSALVWALNEKGAENIIISDRLNGDERWKNLVPLRYSDYIDADDLLKGMSGARDFLGGISTVYHLGACSATTEPDAGFLMRNNFEYSKKLAEWALARRARFVYASSAATYGDGSLGMSDTDPNLDQYRPLTMSGYSKHLFDLYAQRKGILNSMVGLKYFNVFGPNEDHKGEAASLLGRAYAQIVRTGKISLFKSEHPKYKDGEQMRDFLYVKDAVEMTIFLANRPLASGLFNIGSGTASTWLQLAEAVFHALGRQPNIEFIDMPEILKGTYQYYTHSENKKLMAAGYPIAATPLGEAVYDYVINYLVPNKKLGE